VKLRIRSLSTQSAYQLAVVDLLPSGFEVVLQSGTNAQGVDRLVGGGGSWRPGEVDAREDRVIFYGDASPNVGELTYTIRAVARGVFVMPPSQAVGMYSPAIFGRSTAATITVE
jgi:uncharacterized protein YfaS (alpha-2-macroglobulin family)